MGRGLDGAAGSRDAILYRIQDILHPKMPVVPRLKNPAHNFTVFEEKQEFCGRVERLSHTPYSHVHRDQSVEIYLLYIVDFSICFMSLVSRHVSLFSN